MSSHAEQNRSHVAEDGHLAIPEEYREQLGLMPGAGVTIVRVGGSLLVVPDNAEVEDSMNRMADFFRDADVTPEEVTARLAHIRRDEFAKRYPDLAESE